MNNLNKGYVALIVTGICLWRPAVADDIDDLVAAMLGDSAVVDDLRELTDEIGGRVTGSNANRMAVDWALEKFRQAEVAVVSEAFEMPLTWQETHVSANVSGDNRFSVSTVAKPYSIATKGLSAPLIDAGTGSEADFVRLAKSARGAWLLVETAVLDDDVGLTGLFAEYADAAHVEPRAFAAGAAGVVFMSSRPKNLLYRHNAALGTKNRHPVLVMEREDAKRIQRLLSVGKKLTLSASVEVKVAKRDTAHNVIAEIRGRSRAQEIVLFGAHLDSHDMGTGALDNGVNVAMLINIARQITRLGLTPERTIRFALWNGEEQGLVGSWKYTEQHESELDNHVVAASFDIGSGRTSGFFTGGRPELAALVDELLVPVAGLGPFEQHDVPVVGTDNFDFMIEGVANLIAVQSDANYASNYHAESDTFDKVDQYQLRLNSAITAALIWGVANDDTPLPRQTHDEIQTLIDKTDLGQQMKNFAVWDGWAAGTRGRHD